MNKTQNEFSKIKAAVGFVEHDTSLEQSELALQIMAQQSEIQKMQLKNK